MDQATITPVIKKYLEKLRQRVPVEEVILFGSHSSGDSGPESDIDLIFLSSDFSKYDPDTRLRMIYRASTGLPYDFHAYGVTPEEYVSASSLTTLGAIRETHPITIK